MPGRGLNLLSLDGGGIRGLSSLQVLKNLLERVAREQGLSEAPKPCEFFDMIGGTSTGGLIAIMLGRMGMTVDACIDAYIELADKVFRQTHTLPVSWSGKARGKFDSQALESAVKEYLVNCSLPEECLLQDVEHAPCKVFVCATSGSTRQTVLLTSYSTQRTSSDRLKYTKVWQAARATSAATGFFDPMPIQFGAYKESYTDGATGANNPVNHLWHQAKEAFCLDPLEHLEDHVDCVVSIGTGVPTVESFGSGLKSIAKSIVAISTETEITARDFRRTHEDLFQAQRYFRFNVTHGLEQIGLERSDRKDDIINITNNYLDSDETHESISRCVKILVQHTCESHDRAEQRQSLMRRDRQRFNFRGVSSSTQRHNTSLVQNDKNSLLDNISRYDAETRLLCISSRLVPGTARWVLTDEHTRDWEENEDRTFFLCTGIVGSGKTMIASFLVEHCLNKADLTRHLVAFYFLDPEYPRELSVAAVLRGIIRQVATQLERAGKIQNGLTNILKECFASRLTFRSYAELHLILRKLLVVCDGCILIVDGLHEMTEDDIFALLDVMRQLGAHPSLAKKVKIALFCREQVGRQVSIETAVPYAAHLNLTLNLLEHDISTFVDEKVQEKTNCERQLTENEDLLTELRSGLKKHGQKMFLWIHLQLCTIWRTCFNDNDIRAALSNLPLGLKETYSRCLARVSQDEITCKFGHRILYLIAHVQRPLSSLELREAISVQEMGEYWDESRIIGGRLLQYCANLIEQDNVSAIIRFIHPSVKTFLEDQFRPVDYRTSSLLSGQLYQSTDDFQKVGSEYCRDICFKYLALRNFGSSIVLRETVRAVFSKDAALDQALDGSPVARWAWRQRAKLRHQHKKSSHATLEMSVNRVNSDAFGTLHGYHLLIYVQQYWPCHARSLKPDDPAWAAFEQVALAINSSYKLHPWMVPGMHLAQFQRASFVYAIESGNPALLQVLSNENKKSKLASLVEADIDTTGRRAIHLAASKGQGDIVRWLIEVGGRKQLDFEDKEGNRPLHSSASGGSVDVLGVFYDSSVFYGSSPIERLLLQKNKTGQTPLVIASTNSHKEFVKTVMNAMHSMTNSKAKTNLMHDVLATLLQSRPNATGHMPIIQSTIKGLVSALLESSYSVTWGDLLTSALEDDIEIFFSLFLDDPGSLQKIKGTLKNNPPDAPRGTSFLQRACRISATTKPERVQIVSLLLEHLAEEITWAEEIEAKDAEKVDLVTPLSLAMSDVAVSQVAIDVVAILSDRLVQRSSQQYVPHLIKEIGIAPESGVDYLTLLGKIRPASIENLLACGALKLQQHFLSDPKDNLLHLAIEQDTPELLEAILRVETISRSGNMIYSLRAPSNANLTALTLALEVDKPVHCLTILRMAAAALQFEDPFFVQRCKNGHYYRDLMTDLLVEMIDTCATLNVIGDPSTSLMSWRSRIELRNYIERHVGHVQEPVLVACGVETLLAQKIRSKILNICYERPTGIFLGETNIPAELEDSHDFYQLELLWKDTRQTQAEEPSHRDQVLEENRDQVPSNSIPKNIDPSCADFIMPGAWID